VLALGFRLWLDFRFRVYLLFLLSLLHSCHGLLSCYRYEGGGQIRFQILIIEIDRYDFFEADTDSGHSWADISADTDIFKVFKSCFLLHYQKYDVFYALPFFQNLINQNF